MSEETPKQKADRLFKGIMDEFGRRGKEINKAFEIDPGDLGHPPGFRANADERPDSYLEFKGQPKETDALAYLARKQAEYNRLGYIELPDQQLIAYGPDERVNRAKYAALVGEISFLTDVQDELVQSGALNGESNLVLKLTARRMVLENELGKLKN